MAQPIDMQQLVNGIVKAAEASPKLKEKLLKDPKGLIETKLHIKLPQDFKISVFEDTPTKLNIVLPTAQGELSDVQLAGVTGGLGLLLDLDEKKLNQLLLSDDLL